MKSPKLKSAPASLVWSDPTPDQEVFLPTRALTPDEWAQMSNETFSLTDLAKSLTTSYWMWSRTAKLRVADAIFLVMSL